MTDADPAYIDTSALAKWYLPEQNSDAFRDYITGLPSALISALTITEMRCLLARRRRNRQLDTTDEQRAFSAFQNTILQGHLTVLAVDSRHFTEASNLIAMLPDCALRTLDALHLAVATDAGLGGIATADQGFADAAAALGLAVRVF